MLGRLGAFGVNLRTGFLFSSTCSAATCALDPRPKPGDALVYNRHIYYHSAVYLGRGDVILSHAETAKQGPSNLSDAFALMLSQHAIDPSKHYVLHYVPPTGWNLIDKMRHGISRSFTVELMEYEAVKRGNRIFIVKRPKWVGGKGAGYDGLHYEEGSPLSPLQVERLNNAVTHYNSQLGGYDFFFNNCQHFATFVAFGHGAVYPWSLMQMFLFGILVFSLIGTLYIRCTKDDRRKEIGGGEQTEVVPPIKESHGHPYFWSCVFLASLGVVGAVATRHGMVLRLVRCADPI